MVNTSFRKMHFRKLIICASLLPLLASPAFDVHADRFKENLDLTEHYRQPEMAGGTLMLSGAASDSPRTSRESAKQLYYNGESLLDAGDSLKAFDTFTEAASLRPVSIYTERALFALTELAFKLGKYEQSVKASQEFRTNFTDSPLMPDILYLTGRAYFLNGEYLRASNLFDEFKNYPYSVYYPESIAYQGMCLFHLNLISGATDKLEEYMLEFPQRRMMDLVLYYIGKSYEIMELPELAAEAFRRLTLDYPAFPEMLDVLFRLGKNYFDSENYTGAENAFLNYISNTRHFELDRDDALYYIERINFKTGRYRRESEIAINFITKYPSSPRAPKLIFDLARLHRVSNEYADAIAVYRLITENPLYSAYADSAYFSIAETFAESGERNKAVDFLRSISLYSMPLRTQRMYCKIGELYEKWGVYPESIAWYDSARVIDASPELTFRSIWGIARSYRKLNRWVDSSIMYSFLISSYPSHPEISEIYLGLAEIFFLQGRLSESIKATEDALKLIDRTRRTDVTLFLAGMYEEVDAEHAMQLYFSIYSNPLNTTNQRIRALFSSADLSMRNEDNESALEAYKRILSIAEDAFNISKARESIARILSRMDTPNKENGNETPVDNNQKP